MELPFGNRTPSPFACDRMPASEMLTRSVVVCPTRTFLASTTVRPSTSRKSRAPMTTARPVAALRDVLRRGTQDSRVEGDPDGRREHDGEDAAEDHQSVAQPPAAPGGGGGVLGPFRFPLGVAHRVGATVAVHFGFTP